MRDVVLKAKDKIKKTISSINFKSKKTLLFIGLFVVMIASSAILISYSYYTKPGQSTLVIGGYTFLSDADVQLKIYLEDRDDNGYGNGNYSRIYYIPKVNYTYKEDMTFCTNGLAVESYYNNEFTISGDVRGFCKVYFEATTEGPEYVPNSEFKLFVEQTKDAGDYEEAGELPDNDYVYSVNTSLTTCSDSSAEVSIKYRKLQITSSSNTDCSIYVDIEATEGGDVPYLPDTILANNTAFADNVSSEFVSSETGIDFSQKSSDTNGKGLYYTSTNTENNGTTYYFRGDVDNNYVKFGGKELATGSCEYNGSTIPYWSWEEGTTVPITDKNTCESAPVCVDFINIPVAVGLSADDCMSMFSGTLSGNAKWVKDREYFFWRIVRINEDGSVRLILDSSIGSAYYNYDATNGPDPTYAGYMIGDLGLTDSSVFSNKYNSTVKSFVDSWYEENLKDDFSDYLADSGFCNDRTGSDIYNFTGAVPRFSCPNASRDLFTGTNSSVGNHALTYPIGLITANEAIYAGAVVYEYYSGNWPFYLADGGPTWTITPESVAEAVWVSILWAQGNVSSDTYDVAAYEQPVRPVINLKADVIVETGNGTETNPYVIYTD